VRAIAAAPRLKRQARCTRSVWLMRTFSVFRLIDQLHALVWERPVSEVAHRFGISDVGLSKVCRRPNIQVPQRGYWARLDSGQDVRPKQLPAAPSGLPEKIRIRAIAQPYRLPTPT